MSALQAKAQNVYLDQTSDNGNRIVAVQRIWFKSEFFHVRQMQMSIGFAAVGSVYFLDIGIHTYDEKYVFPSDGKVLIRTTKGDVLSLNIITETQMNFVETKWNSSIKEYIDEYTCDLNIPLSDENIQKIITDGIVKIRIEITNGKYIEYELDMTKKKNSKKNTEITKWLSDSYIILKNRLSNPPIDISEDF